MTASSTSTIGAVMKDLYPAPGTRIKLWVVELRRELAWERETCPRIDVAEHIDNTGAECRNVGLTQWTHLDHDSCYVCGDLHEATRTRSDVVEWLALKAARPPRTTDREALSDEVQPEIDLRDHPMLATFGKRSDR